MQNYFDIRRLFDTIDISEIRTKVYPLDLFSSIKGPAFLFNDLSFSDELLFCKMTL